MRTLRYPVIEMANRSASTELHFVDSADEIRESLQHFVAEANLHAELVRNLISHTTYWVYDPRAKSFGPSKFVGFRDMDFSRYEMERSRGEAGTPFDGHRTRTRIEQVLAIPYAPNARFSTALRAWVESIFPDPPYALAGVDTSKWLFASLPGKAKPQDWSDAEVKETVADYMQMLHAELAGEPYNKTAHRTALLKRLPNRNASAVEFKHENISAILHQMGLPYIDGYKPRGNYQGALKAAIEAQLLDNPKLAKAVQGDLDTPVGQPPDASAVRLEDIEVPPRKAPRRIRRERSGPRQASRIGRWRTPPTVTWASKGRNSYVSWKFAI